MGVPGEWGRGRSGSVMGKMEAGTERTAERAIGPEKERKLKKASDGRRAQGACWEF